MVYFTTGDLIPYHVKIFQESTYFKDTSIPCPDKRVLHYDNHNSFIVSLLGAC